MPPDPLSRYLLAQACNNAWADHRLLRACSALSQAEFEDGPKTPYGHKAKLGTYPCFQEIFRAANAAGHARTAEHLRFDETAVIRAAPHFL